jgi:putative ABC transport system ATP-binding protein
VSVSLFSLNNVNFKDILHYPHLEIAEGVVTFVCGESGCGKSTLLKLLGGTVSADGGEVLYRGKSVESYNPVELRREVLLCGQAAYLFAGSVRDNFAEYYRYRDLPCLADNEINLFLEICAARFPLDAPCATMSGGECQRVFTAICLSFRPAVLLLDEPTSALDDETAAAVMAGICGYCQENGITLVVVSHNRALAERFAGRVIVLEGGKRDE